MAKLAIEFYLNEESTGGNLKLLPGFVDQSCRDVCAARYCDGEGHIRHNGDRCFFTRLDEGGRNIHDRHNNVTRLHFEAGTPIACSECPNS